MSEFDTIITGDSRDVLRTLPDNSVNCCVTSPPYFGLRDYGVDGQIGLEPTPDAYVAALVEVFREVLRVLREDGTLFLNLGDSYWGSRPNPGRNDTDKMYHNDCAPRKTPNNFGKQPQCTVCGRFMRYRSGDWYCDHQSKDYKPKDLIGIPWRVAFALQADGWWLRSDIIWSKPNCMPESVTDRPTKAHEYVFLLTKSAEYYYDADAIKEPAVNGDPTPPRGSNGVIGQPNAGRRDKQGEPGKRTYSGFNARWDTRDEPLTHRNKRSVWTIPTQPYSGAHFAVMPEALVEPCILAGCPEGGIVLDPFGGAATVGVVAKRLNRRFILIELNPEYAELGRDRLNGVTPMFPGFAQLTGTEGGA